MIKFGISSAKVLGLDELAAIVDNKTETPVISDLVFVETREKEGSKGKLFPGYVEAYGTPENEDRVSSLMLVMTQIVHGEHSLIRVRMDTKNYLNKFRIWDLPPDDHARAVSVWLDCAELQ